MDRQKMALLGSVGAGAAMGAGLMYLLDPEAGRRRRALARDKAVHSLKTGGKAALRTSRDLGNRTKGLIALGAVGLGLLARGVKNRSLPGLNGGGLKSLLHRRGRADASGETLESLGLDSAGLESTLGIVECELQTLP